MTNVGLTEPKVVDRLPGAPRASLFSPEYRSTTAALVMAATLVAFENLSVATVLPTAVGELGGRASYSWPFTAFLVASVIGMVMAGEWSDRQQQRAMMTAGLVTFAAGLIAAGAARDMVIFVAGRAVQGLGGGILIVAIWAVTAEVYDRSARPRAFAALSAAWVLPALVGPAISGIVTQDATWRLVFLGLVPLVVVGLALVWWALPPSTAREPSAVSRWGLPPVVPMAVVAGAALAALQYAGQHLRPASVPIAIGGVVALGPATRRLLPPGTLRLRVGLPAMIGLRGLVAGAFFGAEAFIPLTLTRVHGYGAAAAGTPLAASALGWWVGSRWLDRHRDLSWLRQIRVGCTLIALGSTGLVAMAWPGVPGWPAAPVWGVASAGMGLSVASLSMLVIGASAEQRRGANGAALQLCDALASAGCIGLGGIILALVPDISVAIMAINAAMAAVAAWAALVAHRVGDANLTAQPAEDESP